MKRRALRLQPCRHWVSSQLTCDSWNPVGPPTQTRDSGLAAQFGHGQKDASTKAPGGPSLAMALLPPWPEMPKWGSLGGPEVSRVQRNWLGDAVLGACG